MKYYFVSFPASFIRVYIWEGIIYRNTPFIFVHEEEYYNQSENSWQWLEGKERSVYDNILVKYRVFYLMALEDLCLHLILQCHTKHESAEKKKFLLQLQTKETVKTR